MSVNNHLSFYMAMHIFERIFLLRFQRHIRAFLLLCIFLDFVYLRLGAWHLSSCGHILHMVCVGVCVCLGVRLCSYSYLLTSKRAMKRALLEAASTSADVPQTVAVVAVI